ncbi:hypothetical protein MVEN_02409000 [Mycena venus]|uniref:Uncharacterized protein n=1 Tax=Mycena venus TaxID=2733690 RepID=A0A8H7CEH2_9AGAR|nr:hypothetical protein MVEN_02409000 [Mycena venus]
MFSAPILLSTTLFSLASATAFAKTYCSPPEVFNVSFGNPDLSGQGPVQPAGAMELAVPGGQGPFLDVFWVTPAASAGPWNIVKNGSQYLIAHADFPGKFLTSVVAAATIELDDGPVGDAQKWNITCTTCPPFGLANNCTFANNPFPNTQFNTQNCILNDRLEELGNATVTGDCHGDVGTAFKINYHLL